MRRSSLLTAVILIIALLSIGVFVPTDAKFGDNCTDTSIATDCGYNGSICSSGVCDCNTTGGYEVIDENCVPSISVSLVGSASSVLYGTSTILTATITSTAVVTSATWHMVSGASITDIKINTAKYTQTGTLGSGTFDLKLTINDVKYTDEASYQINVTNEVGTMNTSNKVPLDVTGDKPTVNVSDPTQSDTTVTIPCSASVTNGAPVTDIKWKKNGTIVPLPDSNNKYSGGTVATPSLSIHNIVSTDEGSYQCVASNTEGPTESSNVDLRRPASVTVVGSLSIVHGTNAVYTGSYTSVLGTSIEWKKNDTIIGDLSSNKYAGSTDTGPNPKLMINFAEFHDAATYQLVVKNGVGSGSKTFTIQVTGGELTVTVGPDITGRYGGSVMIECNVTGPEVNKIQWKKYRDNRVQDIVIDGTKYTGASLSSPSLNVNNLNNDDPGQYQCTARNPGGTYISNVMVTVTTVYGHFNEVCTTAQPCDASKYLTCSSGICLCNTNHYHRNKVCYPRSRLAPSITNTVSTTSQFTVSWNHTSTDYDLVTRYIVSWRVSGGSSATLTQSVERTMTSLTVSSGLVPGQLYSVIVTSVVGLTNPADTMNEPSQERTVRLVPLPPGPILSNESSFAHDNITLKWTPPVNNTIVTKYEVKIGNAIQTTSSSDPSLKFTAKALTPGSYYLISIVTISGTSSDEKRSTAHTETIRITPTKPGPPTNVACPEEPKDISLEISWTPPLYPNGHILKYQINVNPGNLTVNTPNNESKYNVVGLNPQQVYTFVVRTVNDAEDSLQVSGPSVGVNCQTRAGVSTPPTKLVVDEIVSRGFRIKFEKPTNVQGILDAYKIIIWKGSTCVQQISVIGIGNCQKCKSTKGCPAVQNYSVTDINQPVNYNTSGLNPYTHYIVEVAAVNGVGEGNFVNKTTMTDEEVPQKPGQITATDIEPTTLTLTWNVTDPSPGNTSYTIDVYEGTDDTGTSFALRQPKLYTYGFNKQSVSIDKLEEYWPYKFKVDAATIKGNTTSDLSNVFRTKQAAPGQVENFDVKMKDGDYRTAHVYWSIPSLRKRNGALQSYYFTNNHTGMNKPEEILVSLSPSSVERNFTVEPEKVYFVEVYVKNNESMQSQPVTRMYPAPAGPPPIDNNIELITTTPGEHKPSERTFTVEVNVDFFKDDLNGKQVFFGIAVCEESKCDSTYLGTLTMKDKWEGLLNWHKARESGFPLYRVTNGTYMEDIRSGASRRKRSTSSDFTIGIDTTCPSLNSSVYCNGPLNPGQSYKVIIFACTNGGCTQSKANGPYYTIVVKIEEPTNLGLIVGTIVGVVAVLGIVVLVLIFLKRRNRLGKPSKYTEKIETVADIEDPVPKNIPRKRPIRLKELADKVAEKHKDSNLYFAREYEDLKALSAKHPTETSETDSNKLKNRYVNILPFDQTRVKLQLTEDDDPSTDFINANYLPGHKSEREYIATQGPIPGTIDDFWRMIWEQNVSIIVMLTLCKEEGRVKCEMYWPENVKEPKQYGDLVVETVSCSTVNFYDFRIFKIKLGDTTRTLKHFHFLQWKDFSANVQNDVMIDFIKNVRNHIRPPDMNGPVVVHCSAGVGRTGTYCALDHLFQVIDEHDLEHSIDIFDLVLNLREHRMFMVQTEQQYIFIHDCLKDYLEKKLKQDEDVDECLYENQAFVADDPAEESLYQNYSNQRTDL